MILSSGIAADVSGRALLASSIGGVDKHLFRVLATFTEMLDETTEARVERLVLEYAQSVPEGRPLDPGLSLQNDLAIESLSLVSLALRLGGEFGVDIVDLDLELRDLRTLGDLTKVARTLCQQTQPFGEEPNHWGRK